ncbi:checkpoint serine/threonine-protein kinase Bub1p [[Candida] jaroonii]|uniref:Checkpoint serine/threonine-protein kinase Bub1p n=1 Tax=[Candida] jaroonii TaxID=467808 RepID=A0ACA9Y613_9ASCO|nr:checkpoint serine/threonine-protein kinase Bub1p [[Candida] jaroonii]
MIERHKENIQPMVGGRSASGLLESLNRPRSSPMNDKERNKFETQISQLDELDDPLQVFLDYINWTHNAFPMGNNVESGLVNLLERCTSYFKDHEHYKNDSRYLKTWLEYANYSDSPIEVFVYLAKKEIGRELALFYEEFGKLLEVNHKFTDAKEIYEYGIEHNARPINRLLRSFKDFQSRVTYNNDKSEGLKRVLTLKRGNVPDSAPTTVKKSKFNVLVDDSEMSFGKNIFKDADSKEIGSINLRKKENVFNAKPWQGEVLAQRSSSRESGSQKVQVYRDVEVVSVQPTTTHEEVNGKIITVVSKPGKATDKVMVNTQLLYGNEEISMMELLAKNRRLRPKNLDIKEPPIVESTQEFKSRPLTPIKREYEESNTFVIPLKDEESRVLRSPTMTFYSKIANNEVLGMFNGAYDVKDEDAISEANSTNYDGFVTETFNKPIDVKVTPPTQEPSNSSSPFIERPDDIINVVDPLDENLRESLLNSLTPSLESYPGYNNTKTQFIEAIRRFRSITDSRTKVIQKSSSAIVNFCGDEIYSLKCELGQGGFGYVYLIENELGNFKALKAETKSSNWEFYILNQIHQRLSTDEITTKIIKPESLYMYQDESFLILKYLSQGTLLDIVNYYRNQGKGVDEELCIFFTVELLEIIEKLHTIGIIHGDLKADNCMIDFKTDDHRDNKMILIDFGRSIDLFLFPEGTQFTNTWEADQQDCPQMNNNQSWSFEADYYGIAAIIHTLLFGKYIEIETLKSGKNKLKENFKRYWKSEWIGLFDILINPYYNVNEKFPLIDELKYQRQKFQGLLQGCKELPRITSEIAFEMNKKFKSKHN